MDAPELTRRQFVAVTFKPGDRRSYTYVNDGDPVEVGDRVVVDSQKGRSTVTVVGISDEEPPFACKPIVGRADGAPLDTSEEGNF